MKNLSQLGLYFLNGLYQLIIIIVGWIPSNIIRVFLYRHVFRMRIGKSSTIHLGARIRFPWKITIGNNTIIGDNAILDGRKNLFIGNNVNISTEVYIWTLQHDVDSPTFDLVGDQVIINDYAWLSCRVTILPGVEIGKGAVVAAGSVVTKNVAPYSIVAGIPAKVIGQRTKDLEYELVNKVLFV